MKLYCSFCGKEQSEVRKLVAGPSVFICNECHELMGSLMTEPPSDPLKTISMVEFRRKAKVLFGG